MSLSNKTKKWLLKNGPDSLKGKTVIITGANSGIGFKTTEICLSLGANVIMACRNIEKANNAKNELIKQYPKANLSVFELDLASFASIDAFVRKIVNEKVDIDVFVNNAGVFHQPNKTTKDGFEFVIGINYFGTYYLTEKIMPYLLKLKHKVFYINTISIAYKFAKKIDYSNFFYDKKYHNFQVYARSKLCLAKYTYALAEKYKNNNVKVFMSHPGIALTPLGLNVVGQKIARLSKIFGGLFNSVEKSSLSVLYILSHNIPDGSIVGPNKMFGGWGYPKVNKTLKKAKKDADKLIDFTEEKIKAVK